MKKVKLIFVALFGVLLLTGCNSKTTKKEETTLDKLLKVVNEDGQFYGEDNSKNKLSEYSYSGLNGITYEEYYIADLDDDKEDEVIIKAKSDVPFYMVFNVEDNNVYGFTIDKNEMVELKENGYYKSNINDEYFTYNRFGFDKNSLTSVIAALENEVNELYIYNNEPSTKEDVDKFIEEYNNMKTVEFKKGSTVEA